MKKFLFSLLFMAMAIVSVTSFVSCGSSDDDDDPVEEAFLMYKGWLSDDVLALADVVPSGVNITLTAPATYLGVSGKESIVELTGKQATDADFTISLKLKSNWKEILATKDKVEIGYAEGFSKTKGSELSLNSNVHISTYSKKTNGDNYESTVGDRISGIVFKSK